MAAIGTFDELRDAFDAFDTNRDGLVAIDELLEVMRKHGEKMSRDEARASLQQADTDGDGQLSYEEFVAFMLGH